MRRNFWGIVNNVIKSSDIILEVLDARFIQETRNKEIEEKIKRSGKRLIYVINKCDLVSQDYLKKIKLKPSVYVSSKKRYGITKLLHMILAYSDKKSEKVIVGIVGYPNTGKSSVINALKGRGSAKVSSRSGSTRAYQLLKIKKGLYCLDTPGVLPFKEKDEIKHALIASLDISKIDDPELVVYYILEHYPGSIESYYDIGPSKDPEEALEEIALKKHKLTRKGEPDTKSMAQEILKKWQEGKINILLG